MDVYMKRRLVAGGAIAAVLLIIGIAVAGGGDDDEAPITPVGGATGATLGSLSKDQFIDEADAICTEANSALASVEEDAADDPELMATQTFDLVDGELSQLETLSPPEEDSAALDRFLSALQDQADALRKQQLATERQDDTALVEAQTAVSTAEGEVAAAAEEFGFKVCGTSDTGETDAGTAAPVAPAPAPTTPAPAAPTTPTTPAPSGDGGGGGGGTGGSGGITPP